MLLCRKRNSGAVLLRFRLVGTGAGLPARQADAGYAVQAVEPESQAVLASLPPRDMARWLQENGYVWQPGTSGLWRKAAA